MPLQVQVLALPALVASGSRPRLHGRKCPGRAGQAVVRDLCLAAVAALNRIVLARGAGHARASVVSPVAGVAAAVGNRRRAGGGVHVLRAAELHAHHAVLGRVARLADRVALAVRPVEAEAELGARALRGALLGAALGTPRDVASAQAKAVRGTGPAHDALVLHGGVVEAWHARAVQVRRDAARGRGGAVWRARAVHAPYADLPDAAQLAAPPEERRTGVANLLVPRPAGALAGVEGPGAGLGVGRAEAGGLLAAPSIGQLAVWTLHRVIDGAAGAVVIRLAVGARIPGHERVPVVAGHAQAVGELVGPAGVRRQRKLRAGVRRPELAPLAGVAEAAGAPVGPRVARVAHARRQRGRPRRAPGKCGAAQASRGRIHARGGTVRVVGAELTV